MYILTYMHIYITDRCSVLRSDFACCSCNIVWHAAHLEHSHYPTTLGAVAVCCIMLQYVAVCHGMLQCATVCYSVLQYVAV